jgi:ferric-dicitrate binding protein FerR (iron transport regulator)
MPGDPEECRAHARACAEMAERARTEEHRRILQQLERAWLNLAADLERNQTLLDAYPPPPSGRGTAPGPKNGNGTH